MELVLNRFQHLLDTSPRRERAHSCQIQLLMQLVTKEAAGHLLETFGWRETNKSPTCPQK